MQGLHLTADLSGCPVDRPLMTDSAALRELCLKAVNSAGLQPVGELFHRFAPMAGPAHVASSATTSGAQGRPASTGAAEAPAGITGVVLLAESHLAVHTWPEIASVTVDVYVCNFGADNSARAHSLMNALIAAFEPTHVERHALHRGQPGGVR